MPNERFEDAVQLYSQVLQEYPEMRTDWREWGRCWIGLYQWQLGEEEAARTSFESLLAEGTTTDPLQTARLYVDALNDPESTAGIFAVYTRAVRQSGVDAGGNKVILDMSRVASLAKKPFFRPTSTASQSPLSRNRNFFIRLLTPTSGWAGLMRRSSMRIEC